MDREQIENELILKKWEKKGDKEYEQIIEGWRPYYLHYIESERQWRLKQWGMGMSIATFNELNEESITDIFQLCSQYAKEMPW